MAREFRIEVAVTLPDGLMEEAEAIVALKPAMDALNEALNKAAGDPAKVTLDYSVVVPKPRGSKGDAALADVREAA